MKVRSVRTRIYKEKEELAGFVTAHVKKLRNNAILAVTSKIVALSEGRTAPVSDKERVIKSESTWSVPTKFVALTLKDGMLLANAGVDESNGDGKLVLLPKDSYKAAAALRKALMKQFHIRNCGVIITDSRVMPLRAGVIGVALGYAGFKGLRDYRGKKDIFGRKFKFETANVADSLATVAALAMGEGNERQPLAVIEDAPVEFTNTVNKKELIIAEKDDLYRPLLGKKRR
jgi:dihydrofolate synthase / folylpolyglutamate synthase